MTILWDYKTIPVVDHLIGALERGVSVTIVGDVYASLDALFNKKFPPKQSPLTGRQAKNLSKKLSDAGATIVYVGKLGVNPFRLRCHSKVTIVDNDVYSFGGVNFSAGSFACPDYMLVNKGSSELADYLAELVSDIAADNSPEADISLRLNPTDTLLFDCGIPGVSVIYDTACELAAIASRTYFVSQMMPSGDLAHILGHRELIGYFNTPSSIPASAPGSLMALLVDRTKNSLPNLYTRKDFLHAKAMLFEMPDGGKALISGSHNFSWRGVEYGTKEIALYSTNETLWNEVYSFISKEVA